MSKELTIAVVDDDGPFRMALVESLLSLGYGAQGFASAEEFIALDGATSCDCIISDIQMSGMSGLDFKRMLAENGCHLPVIMVTARPEPHLHAQATAVGAVGLLRKPFATDALLDCLRGALNN